MGLVLNEIDINPPGANTPYQYLELRGRAGEAVQNAYVLEIEGDLPQNPGRINSIIPINGVVGANGLMMIRSDSGFEPEDPQTSVYADPFFDSTSVGWQVGSASWLLVAHDISQGAMPVTVGMDLDAGNTGILSLPGSLSRLDSVGVVDGSNGDIAYGTVLGPIGTSTAPDAPDAISRFYDNTTANTDAWFWGNLIGPGNMSKNYAPDVEERSPNFPKGGVLTPGGHLLGQLSAAFNYVGDGQSITVTFNSDVTALASADAFELFNLTTQTTVSLVVDGIEDDGRVVRLSFVNTGGVSPDVLVNGNYRLRVRGGMILPVDYDVFFFFTNADFNHDRKVDFSDLLTIAQNYGRTTGATFATGDANYDHVVNFNDLLLLAQRYGTTLPALQLGTERRSTRPRAAVIDI